VIDIDTICSQDSTLLINKRYTEIFQTAGLLTPRDFFSAGVVVRKKGRKENVRLQLADNGAMFYLKRHDHRRPGPLEWENTLLVSRIGIPTAEPVAAGWTRQGSFFCSKEIAGGVPLDDHIIAQPKANLDAIIHELARITAMLHDAGLFHRDLYLCHFFLTAAKEETFRLHLIDLQRIHRPRLFPRRWVVKDLAALLYSSTALPVRDEDRARFFEAYVSHRGLKGKALPRLRSAVHRKARRMARHNRGGRP